MINRVLERVTQRRPQLVYVIYIRFSLNKSGSWQLSTGGLDFAVVSFIRQASALYGPSLLTSILVSQRHHENMTPFATSRTLIIAIVMMISMRAFSMKTMGMIDKRACFGAG
jgi:hypothetical protein